MLFFFCFCFSSLSVVCLFEIECYSCKCGRSYKTEWMLLMSGVKKCYTRYKCLTGRALFFSSSSSSLLCSVRLLSSPMCAPMFASLQRLMATNYSKTHSLLLLLSFFLFVSKMKWNEKRTGTPQFLCFFFFLLSSLICSLLVSFTYIIFISFSTI